jgi:hypothetical protein
MMPIAKRVEHEIRRKLLKKSDKNIWFEYNFDSILRGTPQERYASYALALGNAPWQTVDEVRAFEHLPPMPEEDEITQADIPQDLNQDGEENPIPSTAPATTPTKDSNASAPS